MTPNVLNMPSPGSAQTAGTFGAGFINPPILPPVSNTGGVVRGAAAVVLGTTVGSLRDQLAGFQISLFQHLFPIPQAPNLEKSTFGQSGTQQQMQEILQDVNSIKATVLAINQITVTPANRIPAGASINTNPNYTFLDNTVINACNVIANDIIHSQNVQIAQLDYATLQGLLNPFYNF